MNSHFVEFEAHERTARFLRESQNERLADVARSPRSWRLSGLLAIISTAIRERRRSLPPSAALPEVHTRPWLNAR
jgi:hypothetical protein